MRPSKVMANALSAAFHRMTHRALPRPVGSRERATRYRHLSAAWSVGKWPRALTARRKRAFNDSIALVTGMKGREGPRVVPLAGRLWPSVR